MELHGSVFLGSDESPRVTTEPATEHSLNSDGTTSTVTMVAEDPEGFDIEYELSTIHREVLFPISLLLQPLLIKVQGIYIYSKYNK